MFTEQQEKWLRKTEDLFLRFGIKSITMDDVARELGISKKTLYQFVDNKDDLVLKMLERHIQEDCQQSEAIHAQASDALHEMLLVMQYNQVDFGKVKANIVYELQRYHPDAWEKMQAYNWGYLYKIVCENLQWGIRDGLYREDLNPDITARMHIASIFTIFDDRVFPKPPYEMQALFAEYIKHYLYAILSEKGKKLLRTRLP